MPLLTHRRDWRRTRATELLGLEHPVIQGPFGSGLSSIELAAAVTASGGLGSFGAQHLDPAGVTSLVDSLHRRIDGVFNVNLWVSTHDVPEADFTDADWDAAVTRLLPLYEELRIEPPQRPRPAAYGFEELADALITAQAPVFSFVYGVPSPEILERCRAADIVTIGTAITVEEAVALDEAGVDAIVASGFEAGGHRVAFLREAEDSLVGTLALVPAVVDAVEAPVIAAGGIATARQAVAALALGADAVQIGTAFLATAQSGVTPEHRAALTSGPRRTRLTRVQTGRLARGLTARITEEIATGDPRIAPYPYQAALMKPVAQAAREQGRLDLAVFWAGQSAPLVRPGRDAGEFVSALVGEVDSLLA